MEQVLNQEAVLAFMRGKTYRPLALGELAEAMGVDPGQVAYFAALLEQLEHEGRVVRTRKKKYGLPEQMGLVVGRLEAHAKGFAFLLPEDPGREDIYIAAADTNGAMHNDRVIGRLLTGVRKGKVEGEVIRVLERANRELVGTLTRGDDYSFVNPDDPRLQQDVFIPSDALGGGQSGDKVVVAVTAWPSGRRLPQGVVMEVLGHSGDPGVDILSLLRRHGLTEAFPREVLAEAALLPQQVAPEELQGRDDYRDWLTVTIDGEDAKDLDDAVSLTWAPNGWRLGVHIADVAYYVRQGSLLDQEALRRGTSVYLVDRVLPMLPPRLANEICSLNAGSDRLTISLVMEVDREGQVRGYRIGPAVIRIDRRLSYREVYQAGVMGERSLQEELADYLPMLTEMLALSRILRRRRWERGALDFNFPESKVQLDDRGRPVAIVKREQTAAEQLIEEFMILANETVANHLRRAGAPCLYRVHEAPADEGLEELRTFLGRLGYRVPAGEEGEPLQPGQLQGILTAARGRPEERLVQLVVLRSMKHARYTAMALGHFGLASRYYCHFTSPIRRYPDLVVHRSIRLLLEGGARAGQELERLRGHLPEIGAQASLREREAEEAERESVDIKKVEYMRDYLGEVFPGVIGSVVSFGFFVELENTVEGLVHVSSLSDDYYLYLETEMALKGRHSGRTFRIGDQVEVQVARVDPEGRRIDFELVTRGK